MEYDNECSVHGTFSGQVCVSCAEVPTDNDCNLHGPFHGMVCPVCYGVAKGASILAGNPPDSIDHTYTGTLEREIERLLGERLTLQSRLALLENVFPMQDGPPIPWALAEKIYAGYVAVFGGDQPLQQIADRGGFGWGEVADMWRNLTTRDRFRAALDAGKEGV